MPDTATDRVVDVRVVLPDQWGAIPLQPSQQRERSVTALVERQFAGVDDQPLLREDTRRQLLLQADRAAISDARMLALSLHRVDGVPIPASLVVHWIDMSRDPQASPGDGTQLLAVRDALEPRGERAPGFTLDIGALEAGAVLRRVHEQPAELDGVEADAIAGGRLLAGTPRRDGRGPTRLRDTAGRPAGAPAGSVRRDRRRTALGAPERDVTDVRRGVRVRRGPDR